jgi:hypothetical protein
MYERFTDRARKVMQLANQEAQRFGHDYVGTEHILLGLVKEGSGVAANVLKNLDIDLGRVRREVEKIVRCPGLFWLGKLPHTPRAKKVVSYAIEEARNFNHNYVGTEHVLLGLLREGEGVGGQVLMNLGLKLEDVREEVLNLLGQQQEAPAQPPQAPAQSFPPAEDPEPARVVASLGDQVRALEKRLQTLEGQLWNARLLLATLIGVLAGAFLGGQAGAAVGLLVGGLVGILGGRILGVLAGAIGGALLTLTYLPDGSLALVGLVLGGLLGACVGDLGKTPGWRKGKRREKVKS